MAEKESSWVERILKYTILGLGILVGGALSGVIAGTLQGIVRGLLGPRFDAWNISWWLKNEPYYLSDFERDQNSPEPYRFNIKVSGSEHELTIQPVQRVGFVRIVGDMKLDDRDIAVILDNQRAQRQLRTEIEASLVNSRAVYSFINAEGDSVELERATGAVVEYRIYPDDLTRKELFDGIIKVDNMLDYIKNRTESVAEFHRP